MSSAFGIRPESFPTTPTKKIQELTSVFCIRPEASPTTPKTPKRGLSPKSQREEQSAQPEGSAKLLKEIVQALDEKFASFQSVIESKQEHWGMRHQALVSAILPRTEKQKQAMTGMCDVHVQTEATSREIFTQTDDVVSIRSSSRKESLPIDEDEFKRKSKKLAGMKRLSDTKEVCLVRSKDAEGNAEAEDPQCDLNEAREASDTENLKPVGSLTKEELRKRADEARQNEMSKRSKSLRVKTDQAVDLIGNWSGKRTMQEQMDEIVLKWPLARYTRLSKWLGRTDGPLSAFVKSRAFRYFTNMLIFLNIALIIFHAKESVESAKDGNTAGGIFRIMDLTFSFCFGIDLGLRLIGERGSFFYTRDRWWNILDLFLVSGDIVNEIIGVIMGFMGQDAPDGYLGALRAGARGCRAGRAARTLKIFRSVSFLTLPREVVAAFNAVPFMLIMYFFIAMFFSLILMQAAVETFLDASATAASKSTIDTYFGSLEASLASLFFTLLGGMDWIIIYNALQSTSIMYSLVFMLFAFFAIVAFMNAITAMCVQSCFARVEQNELEAKFDVSVKFRTQLDNQIREDFYNPLALGRNEFVCTWGQLSKSLEKPLVYGHLESLGLDLSDAKGICKFMAQSDSAPANLHEYARACVRFTRAVRGVDFLPLMLTTKRISSELRDVSDDFRLLRAEGRRIR